MIGIIAVFKDNGSASPEMKGVTTSIVTKRGTRSYDAKCDMINTLMKDDKVDPVGFLILNDEESFYSKRLKAGLSDLQTYMEYHERYIKVLQKNNLPEETIKDIESLMTENERVLMKKVALRVSSCMIRDIEVTSDLAMECYNWDRSLKI